MARNTYELDELRACRVIQFGNHSSFRTALFKSGLTAFVVALLVTFLQVAEMGPRLPVTDEFHYITMADDLKSLGFLTKGEMELNKKPEAYFTPLYPAFLAGATSLSADAENALHCFAIQRVNCDIVSLQPVIWTQVLLASFAAMFAFLAVRNATRSLLVAWGSLVIILATEVLAHYSRHFLTEILSFTLIFMFVSFYISGVRGTNRIFWLLSGLALACSALTRPVYFYLIPLLGLAIFCWCKVCQRQSLQYSMVSSGIFLLSAYLVLLPWMLRTYELTGDFALTSGYSSFILATRVSYNAMTWIEWGAAFIYWLPDFGDKLAEIFFDTADYVRLSWYTPDGFYLYGGQVLRDETLRAAGGAEGHMNYLFDNYILNDPLKHLLVTIPIMLRGMWVGKYVGLIGTVLIVPSFLLLPRGEDRMVFGMFVWPFFAILLLNALVSVNATRYNEVLIIVFASVVAICFVAFSRKLWALVAARVAKFI